MVQEANSEPNVRQAVPFFGVSDMEASVRFYVDGLGFVITNRWVVDGKLRWCWLENGTAALMLQQFAREDDLSWRPSEKLGVGVSICFVCGDALALYREFVSRGMPAERPFVGNNMWVTTLFDPDGYRLEFESPTDVPEDTVYDG